MTIAPLPHQTPLYRAVFGAGPQGVVLDRPGGLYWKSFADGREVPFPDCATGTYGLWMHLGDSVGCEYRKSATTAGPLTLQNLASGRTETLAAQAGRMWTATFSPTQVLATEQDAEGRLTLHLIGRENEPRKDVIVTAPERMAPERFGVRTSDETGALISYRSAAGQEILALLDYATAALTPLALPEGATDPDSVDHGLGTQWISLRKKGSTEVTLRSRADLAVTRSVTTTAPYGRMQPVGDWLVVQDHNATSNAVTAVPVGGGGAPRTLLARTMGRDLTTGTDGSAYLAGTNDPKHWAMHRIASGPDGAPVLSTVRELPAGPADRVTLSLAQGRLIAGQEDPDRSLQGYTVPVSATSQPNQTPDWSCAEATDPRLCTPRAELPGWTVPTGDGRIVSLSSKGDGACGSLCGAVVNVREARPGGTVRHVALPGTDEMQPGLIKSASGRYVLFTVTEKNASRLVVADIDAGKILDFKPSPAATLWGSSLWDRDGTTESAFATDLRTGRITRRQAFGTNCRPDELQVSGDWLYALCPAFAGGPAAFHLSSNKRIPLPFTSEGDRVKLGDGYLVREWGDGLEVYNLRSGKAVREREIAGVSTYGTNWTLDRFGGRLAYTDLDETVHLAAVTGAASPLAAIDQDTATAVDFKQENTWQARWWLSKPVSSWKLTVRNKTSGITTVVRTGTEARGLIAPAWDGKSPTGTYLFSGEYEWTLTARPADGQGAALSTSGTVSVTRGPSGARPPVRP